MFRIILWLIIIVLITFFVVFNVEPKVDVHLFPSVTLQGMPLALVIILSFILGLLCGMLILLPELIRSKIKLSQLEKERNKSSASGEGFSAQDRPSS
ncbi:MAG: LapA family protein [Caldimicrobium sp.]